MELAILFVNTKKIYNNSCHLAYGVGKLLNERLLLRLWFAFDCHIVGVDDNTGHILQFSNAPLSDVLFWTMFLGICMQQKDTTVMHL